MSTIGLHHPAGTVTETAASVSSESTPHRFAYHALALVRILYGLTFLWAFVDKLFGFGYATPAAKSWLNGGSPTKGFLMGSEGPFSSMYHSMAGTTWANVSFMLALLLIGIGLTFGIANRLTTIGGTALYLMMWTVVMPPAQNPFIDDHLIGAATMLVLGAFYAGQHFGLGKWWNATTLVKSVPILK